MAKVTLTHVFKSYDKTDVIKDISLDIQDREFIVLVGPSGCGKSTVLRMIAGLESITNGNIAIGDRVVNEVPPKDRDIAMVFQNYALYPHMNVYDNMAFGLKMRKTDKAEIDQRVKDAARILDLDKYLTRKPKQLSGGQRQRVALGRAIVRNPKVFLMDEPLSNLDAKLRVQMRSEISKLHRRLEATTIYVTHDQLEAMTMGDRIVVLDKGIIQQVDTPMAIYQHPANMFVAGFIGQMNFLTGLSDGGELLLGDGTRIRLSEAMRSAVTADGKALVLGVRPEHFVPNEAHEQGVELTVTPEQIELLGSEQLVHFKVSGTPVVAKLPPEVGATIDQPLTLKLDLQHATLFDGESEQRLG